MAEYIIRSKKDLEKILQNKIDFALKMTQKEIYKIMKQKIADYYHERVFQNGKSDQPAQYERTYQLLNSLIKTNVVFSNDGISCSVEIDRDYLNYEYPGNPNQERTPHLNPATGLDVVEWMDNQSHGATVRGSHEFWTEGIKELGGEVGIISMMKTNLKKCGIPIT